MRELLTLIEGAQWAKTKTLPAGTLLFHGTDDEEFHPSEIKGPAWFSTDHDVAGNFAHGRLLAYRLKTDLTLPMISSAADMEEFAERFNIDRSSSEDVCDSAKRSGIAGWIIPDNYEPGDDILIVDLSVLEAITSDLGNLAESQRRMTGGTEEPHYQIPMWREPRGAKNQSLDEMVKHDHEGVEHMTGSWPKVLNDNRAIAEYIGGLDERVDQEMVEEHFFGAHAVLKLLPIESIKEGNPDGNMRSSAKEKRFAKMDLGTQPPIVIDNGVIADGHHRFRVAKAAGATDILAYDISYDDLTEGHQELDERQTLPLNKGANDGARGLYAAFICVMQPNDFLRLTTDSDAHMDKIRNDEFSDLETYAKDGHEYYKKSNYNMPFLFIEYETGRVVGHEGRHRAAMVEKAGGRSFPCLIVFKNTEKWSLTYEKSSRTGHVDDETVQEIFPSENRAEERADTLRSLNSLDDFDFFYEEFKIEQVSGKTTMKGSPRSQGWDYDAWKTEDFPEKFIGQYDRMVVIPTLRMKFGPVKGYNHFK